MVWIRSVILRLLIVIQQSVILLFMEIGGQPEQVALLIPYFVIQTVNPVLRADNSLEFDAIWLDCQNGRRFNRVMLGIIGDGT